MSTNSNFDRISEAWLAEGPTQLADRVVDAALDEVHLTNQRRRLTVPWRFNRMPNPLRLAAAAVIGVLLVGVIYLNLPGRNDVGGQSQTPLVSPTPSASPTPAPTAGPHQMYSGDLAPGAYFGRVQGKPLTWTFTVPAGWTGNSLWSLTASQGYGGPAGIGIGATGAVNVPSDPCDGVGKTSDGESVADVVAALEARDDLVVSNAIDAALGGYSGTRVDVEVPADLSACDNWFIFAEPDGSGFYAQGPSNLLRIWILDVEGRPIVIQIESFAGTPATDLAEAQQIVDSIVITP